MTDSRDAFTKAIRNGRLSQDESAANFAGNFMFMESSYDFQGFPIDKFKNIKTREDLPL